MEKTFSWVVGVDWGSALHQVCVLDAQGRIVEERAVEHSGAGLGELAQSLLQRCAGQASEVAVAIEVPRGPVVEALVEQGFVVFSINPKQLDRFRDRHSVAGAKDDRRDAFVLAQSLRTDASCFREVRIDDPLVIELRELSRVDDELTQEAIRLANRLRDQLQRYFPALLRLEPAADVPWIWDLLAKAPTPEQAAALSKARLKTLLHERRIRRLSVDEVHAALHEQPLRLMPGSREAAVAHVEILLPRLRVTWEQQRRCRARIEGLLERLSEPGDPEAQRSEHRDVEILRSLPGVGKLVAATMLAEASQLLANRDYHALRVQSGVAPVTRQSGKSKLVKMRYSCNQRLRAAFFYWSRTTVQLDPKAAALFKAHRQRGQSYARALRAVADRMLSLLISLLRRGELYDPARRVVAVV